MSGQTPLYLALEAFLESFVGGDPVKCEEVKSGGYVVTVADPDFPPGDLFSEVDFVEKLMDKVSVPYPRSDKPHHTTIAPSSLSHHSTALTFSQIASALEHCPSSSISTSQLPPDTENSTGSRTQQSTDCSGNDPVVLFALAPMAKHSFSTTACQDSNCQAENPQPSSSYVPQDFPIIPSLQTPSTTNHNPSSSITHPPRASTMRDFPIIPFLQSPSTTNPSSSITHPPRVSMRDFPLFSPIHSTSNHDAPSIPHPPPQTRDFHQLPFDQLPSIEPHPSTPPANNQPDAPETRNSTRFLFDKVFSSTDYLLSLTMDPSILKQPDFYMFPLENSDRQSLQATNDAPMFPFPPIFPENQQLSTVDSTSSPSTYDPNFCHRANFPIPPFQPTFSQQFASQNQPSLHSSYTQFQNRSGWFYEPLFYSDAQHSITNNFAYRIPVPPSSFQMQTSAASPQFASPLLDSSRTPKRATSNLSQPKLTTSSYTQPSEEAPLPDSTISYETPLPSYSQIETIKKIIDNMEVKISCLETSRNLNAVAEIRLLFEVLKQDFIRVASTPSDLLMAYLINNMNFLREIVTKTYEGENYPTNHQVSSAYPPQDSCQMQPQYPSPMLDSVWAPPTGYWSTQ